jgi:hypothetical protein
MNLSYGKHSLACLASIKHASKCCVSGIADQGGYRLIQQIGIEAGSLNIPERSAIHCDG